MVDSGRGRGNKHYRQGVVRDPKLRHDGRESFVPSIEMSGTENRLDRDGQHLVRDGVGAEIQDNEGSKPIGVADAGEVLRRKNVFVYFGPFAYALPRTFD